LLPASCWILPWLALQPWRWWHVSLKRHSTFFRLHSILSQQMELFIIMGVLLLCDSLVILLKDMQLIKI
jgi:hypothetical protein